MDYLVERGQIAASSQRMIAGNSLVLVAPADRPVRIATIDGAAITAALGTRGRISMGDPESVPAGRYGREALQSLGIWPSVSARIIPADNVRAALNFVARGEAPLGIVYATDARLEPRVKVVASFPRESHARIVYPAGAVTGAGPLADEFLRFIEGAVARDLLNRAGFLLPPVPSPDD
jgi:molybdate transport system substrate-binding protein